VDLSDLLLHIAMSFFLFTVANVLDLQQQTGKTRK